MQGEIMRKKGEIERDWAIGLIIGLLFLAAVVWAFFPQIKGLLFGTAYAACYSTQNYDNDPMPDSADTCPCDHYLMSMVSHVNPKSDLGPKCTGIGYYCDKVDGSWENGVCFPTEKVGAGIDAGCGQARNVEGVAEKSVPLKKMDLDMDGSPIEYCSTDPKVCKALRESMCDEASKKDKEGLA